MICTWWIVNSARPRSEGIETWRMVIFRDAGSTEATKLGPGKNFLGSREEVSSHNSDRTGVMWPIYAQNQSSLKIGMVGDPKLLCDTCIKAWVTPLCQEPLAVLPAAALARSRESADDVWTVLSSFRSVLAAGGGTLFKMRWLDGVWLFLFSPQKKCWRTQDWCKKCASPKEGRNANSNHLSFLENAPAIVQVAARLTCFLSHVAADSQDANVKGGGSLKLNRCHVSCTIVRKDGIMVLWVFVHRKIRLGDRIISKNQSIFSSGFRYTHYAWIPRTFHGQS